MIYIKYIKLIPSGAFNLSLITASFVQFLWKTNYTRICEVMDGEKKKESYE